MNDKKWMKQTKCRDIPSQSYACCYHMYLPWKCKFPWEDDSAKEKKFVSIDKCLLPEILSLWELGIKTTGCCCGHGRGLPFISVDSDDIDTMKFLGYKVFHNHFRPNDEDSFIPKTHISCSESKATEV